MKIKRVILSTNKNPLYYDFWNNLSFTYKEKFGITPTLIFFGSKKDKEEIGLSDKYGEIIYENEVPNIPSWQYTWALFYYTQFFKEDVCLTIGIDQIPLGTYFIKDLIKEVDDEKYIILLDDHYQYIKQSTKSWNEGGNCQTSYHIGKGNSFKKIHDFEKNFKDEILKINSLKLNTMWQNGWGTDETYASLNLFNYKNKENIINFSKSKDLIERRIECYRTQETPYNLEQLKNNHYIECHSCRPYSSHKNYLDKLFNNIPKFI